MNIGRDISDGDYDAISIIDFFLEGGYYLVKCKSENNNFQSCHKLGKYVINDGELVCDVVHLNQLADLKQRCNPYEKELRRKIFKLNTAILTKVKVKPINDSALKFRT